METTGIVLDETTSNKIRTTVNGDALPLLDSTGELLGYFITPTQKQKSDGEHATVVSWLDELWPPEVITEAIARSKRDTGPKRTMEDVFRLFEGR